MNTYDAEQRLTDLLVEIDDLRDVYHFQNDDPAAVKEAIKDFAIVKQQMHEVIDQLLITYWHCGSYKG